MTDARWLWLWTITCCCCSPAWSLASRTSGRRAALGGLASLASSPAAFAAGPPELAAPGGLEARFSATSLSPLPGPALFNPFDDRQTYYPTWLFGRWNTTATFVQRTLPFGAESVYYRSMAEGSPRSRSEVVGSTTSYEQRFFFTLADSLSNRATVELGLGTPKSKVIADRAFNAIELNQRYAQFLGLASVDYNPTNDPTRLTAFLQSTSREDFKPVGARRIETTITARASQGALEPAAAVGGEEEDAPREYVCAERARSVLLGPGATEEVFDDETVTQYVLEPPRGGGEEGGVVVRGRARVASYLTPSPSSREGELWQRVGGRAVALYDWDFVMRPLLDDPTSSVMCVPTPKAAEQCRDMVSGTQYVV